MGGDLAHFFVSGLKGSDISADVLRFAFRYLQQLVSAQASRNRDLEQQLQAYRSPSSVPSADQDEGTLVLHEEVADELTLFGSPEPSLNGTSTRRKKFSRSELASVEEMDMDDDEADVDMQDEKSSPSALGEDEDGSGEGEDGEEELRGRKGRDGRPAGTGAKERVKLEENGDMES